MSNRPREGMREEQGNADQGTSSLLNEDRPNSPIPELPTLPCHPCLPCLPAPLSGGRNIRTFLPLTCLNPFDTLVMYKNKVVQVLDFYTWVKHQNRAASVNRNL